MALTEQRTEMARDEKSISRGILGIAVLVCAFQLFWFGSKCLRQIDYDGMAYTGIARHLSQGEFHAAINAFRSPLFSWLIAAFSLVDPDLVRMGKLSNVGAYLLCTWLIYVFTRRLWGSETVAALATLLWVLGRGLASAALGFVTPDFLFAAFTLGYFLILLRCLRGEAEKNWFYLGIVHAFAYLAKAFALPWLALCTLVGAVLSGDSWRARAERVARAAVVPILVAAAWAAVLHSKYDVFTTGSQLKANFLQWTMRAFQGGPDPTYLVLTNTTQKVDQYLVDDPMPPKSWPWTYSVRWREAIPRLLRAELQNVPSVLKEIIIVITPGGALAFLVATWALVRKRRQYPLESRVAIVIAIGATSLVLAYSMLVFDARYLFPLIPLLLAIGSRVLVSEPGGVRLVGRVITSTSDVLVVAGVIFSLFYPSSSFRQITRDFQVACYQAGRDLKDHTEATVVSIGSGPYPEHGVGWEAGYKAAYFGGSRLIAEAEVLPPATRYPDLMKDLNRASPDAILLWGSPSDDKYALLRGELSQSYSGSTRVINDPVRGEVGTVFFTH